MNTPDQNPDRLSRAPASPESREESLGSRESALSVREDAGLAREEAVALREEAIRAREEAAQIRSEFDGLMHQLRDANAHLIVANLRSQELAEAADEANHHKDEFIALVSHELRTPLNAVLGWARILALKQLSEARAARAVETIEHNAASMTLIIDDLLDMSRIIAGTLTLTSQPVDLVAVTQAAVGVVEPMAAAKQIDLRFSADASVRDVVDGDPDRLQQVIANLLTNAIKFTPDGGRVEVSVEHVGSQMEVKVADTGQGIGADFLPQVFERYRQAGRVTSRQHGLGLGLAIVKQLVELHGGTVQASSEGEGRGATFTFRMPILAAVQPERSPSFDRRLTEVLESPQRHAERLEGLHVLLVDDAADGRALTSLVLEHAGASVVAVASPREALEHIRHRQRPDVLVTDIGLPEEDGYSLLDQLREHETEHGGCLPVIALTGFARAEDRARILAAGFQAHVAKPFDAAELTAAIAAAARLADER